MTEEAYRIVSFLQGSPETYYARREIARRAVKRIVYEANPYWADAALASLVAGGVVEQSPEGRYRLKQDSFLSSQQSPAKASAKAQ